MTFQKFTETKRGRGRPKSTELMMSIRKSGTIGVNRAALDEFFEGKDGAVMYYDEENNRIGIEPVEDAEADDAAYTVTKSDASGTIAAQAFLRKYDLVPEITTQYAPKWDDEEELVVIDVDDYLKTYGSKE